MKTIKIETTGTLPEAVRGLILPYAGKESIRGIIQNLDEDITMLVREMEEAHGRLNPHTCEASLWPRDGRNTWNVQIEF